MKIKSWLGVLFVFLGLATGIYGVTITTTLDTNSPIQSPSYRPETGLQTGRLNRNGSASACGSFKTNPGEITNTGDRRYDEFEFVALATGCITVTLSNDTGTLFAVAYDVSGIIPVDTSLSYLADIGGSPTSGAPVKSFSFDVVEGQVFNIVVHEVDPAEGVGQAYTLDVSGVKIKPDLSVTEVLDANAPQLSYAYDRQTGNQTGRINRLGGSSTCTSPKTNPGLFTPDGNRRRDLYRIVPFTSGCASVTISHTGADMAHVVAYDSNGFDPNSPEVNYLADSGASAANRVRHFSFLVQAGVPFDLVVHEVSPGAGVGDGYTLNISGVKLASTIEINGRLDATAPAPDPDFSPVSGNQTGRLNRFSPVSTCDSPKVNPGLFTASGARRYDAYRFTPTASGCVEVVLYSNADGAFFSVAYGPGGFNPADPSLNYLADAAASPVNSSPERTYSFNVTAGVAFTITVHEVNPGLGVGQNYRLIVRGRPLSATRRAGPFDFDGDGRTDVAIFRPSLGQWWYLRSSDTNNRAYQFGQATDKIVPADYTGDGRTDIAFYRPSTGQWFVLRSEDTTFYSFTFGATGDLAAPGDFDNDGKADPAVYRPSAGAWYVWRSRDGGVSITNFGTAEDKPVVGDYDGDNFDDIAIYRPSVGQWWIRRSSEGVIVYQFGSFSDTPIPADFTGDGRTDVAFFRPSNEWYVLRSDDTSFFAFPFGTGGDISAPGDFDGDGVADANVFRPSTHTWYTQQSTNGFGAITFGLSGDVPVPSAFQP